MSDENLHHVLAILNAWWELESIPTDMLRARVVMMFKKGNVSDLGNYRRISLLTTIYKVFAAIVKTWLERGIDTFLQHTQYGFRKNEARQMRSSA